MRYTPFIMPTPQQTIDQQFLEMRWRILSLAADFDRIQRAAGGSPDAIKTDPRLAKLRQGMQIVLSHDPGRAERFETPLSDQTPPPKR